MLKLLWQTLYQVPVLMGYGAFWALNDAEAHSLSKSTQDVLKTVPLKQRKAVMNVLNNYLPITSFVATIAIITYPRVMTTQAMMAAQKGANNGGTINEQRNENSTGGANQGNTANVVSFGPAPFPGYSPT